MKEKEIEQSHWTVIRKIKWKRSRIRTQVQIVSIEVLFSDLLNYPGRHTLKLAQPISSLKNMSLVSTRALKKNHHIRKYIIHLLATDHFPAEVDTKIAGCHVNLLSQNCCHRPDSWSDF